MQLFVIYEVNRARKLHTLTNLCSKSLFMESGPAIKCRIADFATSTVERWHQDRIRPISPFGLLSEEARIHMLIEHAISTLSRFNFEVISVRCGTLFWALHRLNYEPFFAYQIFSKYNSHPFPWNIESKINSSPALHPSRHRTARRWTGTCRSPLPMALVQARAPIPHFRWWPALTASY